jgi:hypothetical protein
MILHIQTPHGVATEEADSLLDEVLKTIPILTDSLTEDWQRFPNKRPTVKDQDETSGGGVVAGRPPAHSGSCCATSANGSSGLHM